MSDRKIGNNKESCKLYKAANRLERNKKRCVARHARAVARKATQIARRIKLGKPVPTRHTTVNPDGSWQNLGPTSNGHRWVYSVGSLYREWLTPIDRATGDKLKRS